MRVGPTLKRAAESGPLPPLYGMSSRHGEPRCHAKPGSAMQAPPHRNTLFVTALWAAWSLWCMSWCTPGLAQERARGQKGEALPSVELSPGYYGALQFDAPIPGAYDLPALGTAGNGQVLDRRGRSVSLHDLYGDKIVLLSFIYASCNDVNGCPLATAVFFRIKTRLLEEPDLQRHLRLLTLSFDPERDTPKIMAQYGATLQGGQIDWRFLTAASEERLRPILDDYDQTVQKQYDDQGRPTGAFSHTLRVYLIDRERRLRNIYSVGFLHPDILVNDVKTLLLEGAAGNGGGEARPGNGLHGAGDDKTGYETRDYRTRAKDLTQRRGKPADLAALAAVPPLGLPPPPIPAHNRLTGDKIALGRKLFYDRRLALNGTFSCAMCHIPEQGFTSNELATAVGIEGRTVRRNSPTLYNVVYATRLFHDGREDTLELQIWAPLLARNEMGNPSPGVVLRKIRSLPDYQGLFERAFGKTLSMETLGMALASYQRTLLSADSAFDRWYYGKEKGAMTAEAMRGFRLFAGKARCIACHTLTDQHALFSDYKMHNTGHGYRASVKTRPPAKKKLLVAPGQHLEIETALFDPVSEKKPNDVGLYEITEDPADRWKYRTPSLRNVALTGPYMHDGGIKTLREVVEFYNQGGEPNETLSPTIRPLGLSPLEIDALVAFLRSLTGSNVDRLISDAFAAPIGDPR